MYLHPNKNFEAGNSLQEMVLNFLALPVQSQSYNLLIYSRAGLVSIVGFHTPST